MASLTLDDYTIAWVCALPLEAAAARVMLDKTHSLPQNINDQNAYAAEPGDRNSSWPILRGDCFFKLGDLVFATDKSAVPCEGDDPVASHFLLMIGRHDRQQEFRVRSGC